MLFLITLQLISNRPKQTIAIASHLNTLQAILGELLANLCHVRLMLGFLLLPFFMLLLFPLILLILLLANTTTLVFAHLIIYYSYH